MEINVKESLISLLFENEGCLEGFKRDRYDGTFHGFYNKYRPLFDQIDKEYNDTLDKAGYINGVTDAFMAAAIKREEETPKRKRRGNFYIDQNFQMTLYVLPCLIEYNKESTTALLENLTEKWNAHFKQYSLKPGSFADINGGFKSRLCYVTTAVCDSLGKGRDCYEINLLKNYRDSYLMETEEGSRLVNEYYDIAPTIVNRINKLEESQDIYKNIYDTYINPCIRLIENGDNEGTKELYVTMTRELQSKYFYNN